MGLVCISNSKFQVHQNWLWLQRYMDQNLSYPTSQKCKILNLVSYQNYGINSKQILHDDKDHQMLFVGSLNKYTTNPR